MTAGRVDVDELLEDLLSIAAELSHYPGLDGLATRILRDEISLRRARDIIQAARTAHPMT